jgi:hypothetical protein
MIDKDDIFSVLETKTNNELFRLHHHVVYRRNKIVFNKLGYSNIAYEDKYDLSNPEDLRRLADDLEKVESLRILDK